MYSNYSTVGDSVAVTYCKCILITALWVTVLQWLAVGLVCLVIIAFITKVAHKKCLSATQGNSSNINVKTSSNETNAKTIDEDFQQNSKGN